MNIELPASLNAELVRDRRAGTDWRDRQWDYFASVRFGKTEIKRIKIPDSRFGDLNYSQFREEREAEIVEEVVAAWLTKLIQRIEGPK